MADVYFNSECEFCGQEKTVVATSPIGVYCKDC